jgi:hypothetical protein
VFCIHTAPRDFLYKNHWHAPDPAGVSGSVAYLPCTGSTCIWILYSNSSSPGDKGKAINRVEYIRTWCSNPELPRGLLTRPIGTVTLLKSKLFISRSRPFLILMTVLGCPRHADSKVSVKYYQGPTTS